MLETMEKELETQFTDLLSIVNDEEISFEDAVLDSNPPQSSENNLKAINSRLNDELDEQLQSIEQVKGELDEELRKRDSLIIEFDKLDQNGYFSNESNNLLDFFDTTDYAKSSNNCETIAEEKDEGKEGIVDVGSSFDSSNNFFNLSRTNLNSVLEEDENEDSQNDDLIELNDLNNELNQTDQRELDNLIVDDCTDSRGVNDRTLSPKMKRNSISTNSSSIANDSLVTQNSTLTTISSSTTTSALDSMLPKIIRNESVLNLESLNSETNILVNNIVKKSILQVWQQNKFNKTLTSSTSMNSLKINAKRIFFSIGTTKLRNWKSRYFMLTENYLLCFKKGNKSDFLSKMGKFQFKLNLLEDIRSISLNQTSSHGKSYSIDINEGMMLLFDKDYNLLKEWYDSLIKTRQRCEMMRQEQEIKFRKEKHGIKQKEIKEILSERIERRKMVVSSVENRRVSLLDKFSDKYLDKSLHNSSDKLSSNKSKDPVDEDAFEYLNNLRQRLSGAASVTELRSNSNQAQAKNNTPIINNRKRMSLQRKSLLSQFDSFLGSPLSHSSSKQQIHQQPQDNIANLANLANLTSAASNNSNWDNQNQKLVVECIESPTMLPRIAPQCQGNAGVGQMGKQQLTNSCSVFHLGGVSSSVHSSPFAINNSPALTQRSLYAERLLSNSSLALSNFSRFSSSRNSTLSGGTSFSQSLFKPFKSKPFRDSIHYATSSRKDNPEVASKSHLKSATSEFSFIRLTNNSSNNSTMIKTAGDDDTLKRNNRNLGLHFNRNHSFANECSDQMDSEQDLSTSTADYNSDTLRNELRNSKTITNLNSEMVNRTLILNPSDIGLGDRNSENVDKLNQLNQTSGLVKNKQNLMNKNHQHNHNYQKLKKINNSLDESDSTFSSSNSSSCSSSNYHPILNHQRHAQTSRIDQINSKNNRDLLSYSPKLNHSPHLISSSKRNDLPANNLVMIANQSSPLLNQSRNKKSHPSNDHTYQKVNSKRSISNKNISSTKMSSHCNGSNNGKVSNNVKSQTKKKSSSIPVPISNRNFGLNEPIYQSTEKRKNRMNRILENQSKIYVTMSDLK